MLPGGEFVTRGKFHYEVRQRDRLLATYLQRLRAGGGVSGRTMYGKGGAMRHGPCLHVGSKSVQVPLDFVVVVSPYEAVPRKGRRVLMVHASNI